MHQAYSWLCVFGHGSNPAQFQDLITMLLEANLIAVTMS
jgi:hypothetical protein